MLAGVVGQKPRRPNLVRIAQILRLPASQRHHPRLGLDRDRRLLARAGTLVERRHRSIGLCSLDVASDLLMMHSQGLTDRIERRVLPIGQQHPRPLDTTRGFRARARNRLQLPQLRSLDRQLNQSPSSRHDLRLVQRIKDQATRPRRQGESRSYA